MKKGHIAKTYDPSHTGNILRPWLAEVKQRFASFKLDVRREVTGVLLDGLRTNAFDPNQPRDADGKWTGVGYAAQKRKDLLSGARYDAIDAYVPDAKKDVARFLSQLPDSVLLAADLRGGFYITENPGAVGEELERIGVSNWDGANGMYDYSTGTVYAALYNWEDLKTGINGESEDRPGVSGRSLFHEIGHATQWGQSPAWTKAVEADFGYVGDKEETFAEHFAAYLVKDSGEDWSTKPNIKAFLDDNMGAMKANAQYAFQTSPQRLERFKTWIDLRMKNGLLTVQDGNPQNVYLGKWWAGKYIASAYKKGMTRAIDEMKKAGIPGYRNITPIETEAPEHFGTADYDNGLELRRPIKATTPDGIPAEVAGAFNTPINADRVAMLYGRTFEGMKGLTDSMKSSLAGILAQAMVDGRNPHDIAKDINKALDIGEARAAVIARTEIIRAHHVGAINTYKEAGVRGVKTMAELVTVSGDVGNFEEMHVCPKCQELQEQTAQEPLTLEEMLPLIPVHPNCLISWQTLVYTSKGWKPVGGIQVGDLVLTHKGRFRKVTKKHVNKAHAPEVTFLKAGRFQLSLTSNHPVLVNGQWREAGAVATGDSLSVLATPCKLCGALKPYWRDYCDHTCLSKSITAKQWAKPEHRANIANKNKASMLAQYSSDARDRYAVTANANIATRAQVVAGTHPLQLLDRRGDKNPAKRPEVRAKISASKMGFGNAMMRPEVSAKVSVALKRLFKEHPEKHINALLAQKARVKDGALTWIETAMRRELVALGLSPVYNHGVDGLWVDFAFPDKKIAVECDGAYWHKDSAKETKRDKRLQALGWTVLHFTGSRIKANAKECAAEVYRLLCNHAGRYQFVPVEVTAVETRISHKRGGCLYNLTVAEDESYIAKGFIVHNCRCVAIPVITDIEG